MLTCRFYSVCTNDIADLSSSDYRSAISELVEQVKNKGSFESDLPVFDRLEFIKSLERIDGDVIGECFFSILLTCSSPNDILDCYSDENVSEFGYINEAIVHDAATEVEKYISAAYLGEAYYST